MKKKQVLFLFTQFIERQIVLFDALEQAAFEDTTSLPKENSIAYLFEHYHTKKEQQSFKNALEKYKTRIVLTAHPTQFYPEAI